jgi:DNA-binding transcriptional ArsR family regulator
MRTRPRIDVLFPKTRRAILATTFGQPERRWYMRELARHLRVAPSSLQRELASLVQGGILRESREGKHVYYQPATELPFFEDLHGLILKTVGLADVIRGALDSFADRIQWAFIYGSIARSEEHAASDVDLLILGRVNLAEVSGPLRGAEESLGRAVNPIVYTADQFARKVQGKHHFAVDVLRSKKLFLIGDAREFGRTFGQQAPGTPPPHQRNRN